MYPTFYLWGTAYIITRENNIWKIKSRFIMFEVYTFINERICYISPHSVARGIITKFTFIRYIYVYSHMHVRYIANITREQNLYASQRGAIITRKHTSTHGAARWPLKALIYPSINYHLRYRGFNITYHSNKRQICSRATYIMTFYALSNTISITYITHISLTIYRHF